MKFKLSALVSRASALIAAFSIALSPVDVSAQSGRSVPVVRDAEIEALVAEYAKPLLKAAGLSRSGIEIVLVNSNDFNAFVAGRRIFVNTGAILKTETPNQLIGILAHEIGHLAGGHQQRLRQQLERAKIVAAVAGLLGAGVAVAGAASDLPGVAQAGSGMMAGGGGLAMRGLASYQRGEETTADRAALTYLEATGQSAHGLIETFEILDRNSFFGRGRSGYVSSHPMPRDRITMLRAKAAESRFYGKKDSPSLQDRHDLARAKIAAYTGGAGDVGRLFSSNPRSRGASYGDAIATHLAGMNAQALTKIDALIQSDPGNPWFHEMRGEILMDAGRGAEAASSFRKAAQLDKTGSGILKAEIGQALVTSGDSSRLKEAIKLIQAGLLSDPTNASAYRFLAMAYGRLGDVARAELATAEGYWHAGAFREAKTFAARAHSKLPAGSPARRRAEDILNTTIRGD